MRAHDANRRVRVLPNQQCGVRERAGVTRTEAERSVWVLAPGGMRYEGAAAVNRVLRELPGWAWLTRFYDLPPLAALEEAAYRWVARHRAFLSRRFGATPECALPGADCAPPVDPPAHGTP